MGREVRRVPAHWQHPRYPDNHYQRAGQYIPMLEGGCYAELAAEWDEAWTKWQEGLCKSYLSDVAWEPIDPKYRGLSYTEYDGPRPSPDDYMPDWPADQRTHLMMYEDTSEGTPISPAFETPEELAHWLANTGASSFAGMPATYEQWLRVAQGGFAPSAIVENDLVRSGVAL